MQIEFAAQREAALTQAMSQIEVGLLSQLWCTFDCAVAQDRVEILIDPDTRPAYVTLQPFCGIWYHWMIVRTVLETSSFGTLISHFFVHWIWMDLICSPTVHVHFLRRSGAAQDLGAGCSPSGRGAFLNRLGMSRSFQVQTPNRSKKSGRYFHAFYPDFFLSHQQSIHLLDVFYHIELLFTVPCVSICIHLYPFVVS